MLEILEEFIHIESILRPTLMETLGNKPATGTGSNWNYVYDFAKEIEVVKEVGDYVKITQIGKDVFTRKLYGTKDELTNFIFEKCLFKNKNYVNFLEKFHSQFNKLILYTGELEEDEIDEMETLTELEIIKRHQSYWQIRNDIKNLVNINRNHTKKSKKTAEQRERENANKIQVGNCAEELSEKYEKSECKKDGRDVGMIDRVSVNNDNLGYDIASIWKNGAKKNDKFIEVKGRKFEESSFIISDAELEVAEEKGNKYVIYFWDKVSKYLEDAAIAKFKKPYKQLNDEEKKTLDCKTCDSAEPTRIIRDPIKTLKIKRCKNCKTYEIEL